MSASPAGSSLPVTRLKGVGPKAAERLARLGIQSIQDLLFHLPLRYQDRTRVVPLGSVRPGDQVTIEGKVEAEEIKLGRRRSLLVWLADGTGGIVLRFFHFSNAQRQGLIPGTRLRCFGEVRQGPASLELIHPEYQRLEDDEPITVEEALTPIYPTTEGMHQLTWRDLTGQALEWLAREPGLLRDWLPAELTERLKLPALLPSLRLLHRPPPDTPQALLLEGRHPAQRRLAFEEMLAQQISLRRFRIRQRQDSAPGLDGDEALIQRLLEQLPFELTDAQQRVCQEIRTDLADTHPMLRLVQGDVGSGKTVVAAIAALQAIANGYQVALMAPTELLAEQHLNNLIGWLEPLAIRLEGLLGGQRNKQRDQKLADLAAGDIQLCIGTHALFQKDVRFARLGLVIVDEQHRFGVHQRLSLRDKGDGLSPHQLIMTATPIPRTLAMTAYADLDLSVIDELPPGRTPVKTVAVSDERRIEVIQRVHQACRDGRQTYWVCTLIEESEALQAQAAEDTANDLAEALPDLRVGLVHGRLKSAEKDSVMQRFKSGDLDLLVATTVIEVGVDVPNASLMIIENPERLGLAQLHQLRGRVGRGQVISHCLLLYHPPLSENARARLGVLRDTNDGFRVAQRDLELRGPGEVLGTRQTGEVAFRIADLLRDADLVEPVQTAADWLLAKDAAAANALIHRWIGERTQYAGV